MMRHILLCLAGLALVGCALNPRANTPIRYYELAVPAVSPAATPADRSVRIGRFRALGGLDVRFVYRQDENEVSLDDYHRWAALPERLLAREFYRGLLASSRFAAVLPTASGEADLEVSGDLLSLESTPEGQALLDVAVRITDVRTGTVLVAERYRLHQRLEKRTADELARTLSTLLGEVVSATADQLATVELAAAE